MHRQAPRLNQHLGEPRLEIHPTDAARLGIAAATLIAVSNPTGRAILRALITDRVQPGHVFAPLHWTGQTAPTGRIDALVPGAVDLLSGQPETPYAAQWFGFAVCTTDIIPECAYWARSRVAQGWKAELAGDSLPADWESSARQIFRLPVADCQSIADPATGTVRLAFTQGESLVAALFVSRIPVALSRDYLITQLGQPAAHPLSGRPSADVPDHGAVVCACLGVGLNTIGTAISTGRACTVAQVGTATGAGTNCGSCRPEIATLMARILIPAEAAE